MKRLLLILAVATMLTGCASIKRAYIDYSYWAAETFDPHPQIENPAE